MMTLALCKILLVPILLGTVFMLGACNNHETNGLFIIDTIINPSSEYIVVIGDIQEYTSNDVASQYYIKTIDWISCQNAYYHNIKAVLQTGDITWNNLRSQWERFYNISVSIADEILFVSCIGNHDYTYDSNQMIENRNNTLYSLYTSFNLTREKTVSSFEEGKMENIIVECEVLGEKYYILTLEFGPRKEVLEWALQHIQSNIDNKYIVLTHEYLSGKGSRLKNGYYYVLQNTTTSSPEEVWNTLVNLNDNVMCVLCGHATGLNIVLTSPNKTGRWVSQIMFNLQYQVNGGNGIIQLWEFPQNGYFVNMHVYNTITKEILESSQFQYRD